MLSCYHGCLIPFEFVPQSSNIASNFLRPLRLPSHNVICMSQLLYIPFLKVDLKIFNHFWRKKDIAYHITTWICSICIFLFVAWHSLYLRIRAICICINTIIVFLRDARLAISAIGNNSREESQETLTLETIRCVFQPDVSKPSQLTIRDMYFIISD